MPDDLSGFGYCGTHDSIHARDQDGYMCDDPRPPPLALILKRPGYFQRLLDWLIPVRPK